MEAVTERERDGRQSTKIFVYNLLPPDAITEPCVTCPMQGPPGVCLSQWSERCCNSYVKIDPDKDIYFLNNTSLNDGIVEMDLVNSKMNNRAVNC